MHAKIQLIPMQNAKVLNQGRYNTERAIGKKLGKIMTKLKDNYNSFPELQTKFFHTQCVKINWFRCKMQRFWIKTGRTICRKLGKIWSFLPSLNEFHQKLYILKISGTIVQQLAMRKKVTTSPKSFLPSFNEFHHKLYILKIYLPVTFSKYNKTSPKLVYS